MKSKPKIKHQIIEVKEYVFPIFFTIMTAFFVLALSLFVYNLGDEILYSIAIPVAWILWSYVIFKNDLWRPKKIKYVEHIIIENKKGDNKKNGSKKHNNM